MNLYDYCIQNHLNHLIEEWDEEKNPISISDVSGHSSKKAFWKDSLGHMWEATINNRVNGARCPYCANKKVLKGFNDLKTIRPDLSEEWDYKKNAPLLPEYFTPGSNEKVWWSGKCYHEGQQRIGDRSRGQGCPYCEGNSVLKGFNDLESLFPSIASEWDNAENKEVKPSGVLAKSNHKYIWICSKGHKYKCSPYRRTLGHGCPVCANVKVLIGYNDLQSNYPDLSREWNKEKNEKAPDEYVYGSAKVVWWICHNGHEWKAAINARVAGSGCPYCINKKVWQGDNDLETTNQEIAKEWNQIKNRGLKPSQVSAGSSRKVWWKCSKGHEWQELPVARTLQGLWRPRAGPRSRRRSL